MKRWLWFAVSMILSTGVYFTIRYGLRPKPIPVINATSFQQPGEIGAVIYRRLRQEIRAERILILGSLPEVADYEQMWTGLLKTAAADHVKTPVLFQRDGLKVPYADAVWETVPFTEAMVQSGELVEKIKAKVGAGQLVVVHDSTPEVSHLMKASLSRTLDKALGRPVLSISALAVSLRPEDIQILQDRCMAGGEDVRIECAKYRVGKILNKKKLEAGKLWAVMERHGLKEYLVFIHH